MFNKILSFASNAISLVSPFLYQYSLLLGWIAFVIAIINVVIYIYKLVNRYFYID